eukprot:TRINITY_DN19346_c0_g1_i1.p1 TRINITY_DN19346_c0_g1~~TRINITY_DN19346_c0_g1_i1.p1  ORF type:complete len:289 (-),score=31.60 TRINITY_DN19346_c0_g1_i1:316-1182(-)
MRSLAQLLEKCRHLALPVLASLLPLPARTLVSGALCASPFALIMALSDGIAARSRHGFKEERHRVSCCWLRLSLATLLLTRARAQEYDANPRGWGAISALPERDSTQYLRLLRTDYKFRLQDDYVQYTIDMLVQPCKDLLKAGKFGKDCCYEMNRPACQHHPIIRAGLDLQIAYFQNVHVPTCAGTAFDGDPNCGTYIEVHKPGDREILGDVRIDSNLEGGLLNGYRTASIATHRLCLGAHELWWVVRTRSGPYVQKIREFFVEYPSCDAPRGAIPAPGHDAPPPAMP